VSWGTISSSVGNYVDYWDCWWLLATSPDVEIRISFSEFRTEQTHYYVEVHRCRNVLCSDPEVILKHSGYTVPEGKYWSMTGFLKVVLYQIIGKDIAAL
jgi:hypothetical protein